MSSPREVIARAIQEGYETRRLKMDVWLDMADAVIDALERMEVTATMCDAAWEVPAYKFRDITTRKVWRAMVRAMRDE